MNLLLDTHTFIWWASDPDKLSADANSALRDVTNTLYLSVASIWELQIKLQLGKVTLPKPLPDLVQNQQRVNGIRLLAIEPSHIYGLDTLPLHHKDPFDRLIIAQALAEQLTVVGADGKFEAYSVSLLW
jgi:PIN domain nuclease of toxin-antitoxin system